MPENPNSLSARATHTVADLTGRTDDEIRLLVGVAVAGVAVAATIRTVEILMNLGASFARRATRSGK